MCDRDDAADEIFDSADSGASETFPQQCSQLRKGGVVCIKNRPCKIVEMSVSKTGKHGHAKVHMVGLDLFTGKKYEDICPSTHNMTVPHVYRKDYTVVNVTDDDYISLMDQEDYQVRDDLKLPDGPVGKEIKEKFEKEDGLLVTVVKAMGEEVVTAAKNAKQS